MSRRSIGDKRRKKLMKMFRADVEARLDLVKWLKDRGYARTTGEALILINLGCVRHESHKLGSRMVPAHLRAGIYVVAPDKEKMTSA